MAKKNFWDNDGALETLKKRGLDATCPPQLGSYLRPGLKVLDVGCGPGPVTLDVALVVRPGSVIGVDSAERLIEAAKALAEELQVDNATFQVGSAAVLLFFSLMPAPPPARFAAGDKSAIRGLPPAVRARQIRPPVHRAGS